MADKMEKYDYDITVEITYEPMGKLGYFDDYTDLIYKDIKVRTVDKRGKHHDNTTMVSIGGKLWEIEPCPDEINRLVSLRAYLDEIVKEKEMEHPYLEKINLCIREFLEEYKELDEEERRFAEDTASDLRESYLCIVFDLLYPGIYNAFVWNEVNDQEIPYSEAKKEWEQCDKEGLVWRKTVRAEQAEAFKPLTPLFDGC